MRRRRLLVGLAATAVVLGLAAVSPPGRGIISERLMLRDAARAYLIGYPLVTMQATRAAIGDPVNAFTHVRYLPDTRREVNVVSPSRDTLYSSAWLDLADGPVLISQPDMGRRYWLMTVLDAWTNVVADPGARTLGNRPHDILVAGPDWRGEAPPGAQVYRSPTDWAWALLRIEVDGDRAGAADLQDGFRIATATGAVGNPARTVEQPRRAVDVRAEVDGMSGEQFFAALAEALMTQGLVPDDPQAVDALARVGIVAGRRFAPDALSGAQRRGLSRAPSRVQGAMTEAFEAGEASRFSNGWRIPPMTLGAYGTDYPLRAVVAREGLGANLAADAVYATAVADASGAPLRAGNEYVLDVSDVPVRAFWSVTVYDDRGRFPSGSAAGLSVTGGPQESTRIRISAGRPAAGAWLRAPSEGRFRLLMRLYRPRNPVLDGQWEFPAVKGTP